MTEPAPSNPIWPDAWASRSVCHLITTGRRTGKPHRIEIWFAAENGRIYLLSGGRDGSDWVRNLQASPAVSIELGGETRSGTARVLESGTPEDQHARDLLVGKYSGGGNSLDEWGRTSLPIRIEFPT
jgi:deazaflavin-dependent oxidoreductase (nitroreductase family)